MSNVNRQILLRERPTGAVADRHFELVETPMPEIGDGEALVRTLYLSIDPTIKGWIERDTYLPAVPVGDVVRSGGIGEVVESRSSAWQKGELVFGTVGWQEYSVAGPGAMALPVPKGIDPTDALSIFGITGMTAYFGMTDIGQPKEGETVVVSGAAGATGSVAGQIAKNLGCHVVGIAGTEAKCAWLTDELGFDAAIDYKREDVAARLRELCPKGVDVFFDNVGGPILDAVLAQLRLRARVVVCGAISQYDDFDDVYGPKNYINVISSRARMEGFVILDYLDRFGEGAAQLGQWLGEGRLKYRKTVVEGLENAPQALMRLFTGDHDGKMMVKVA